MQVSILTATMNRAHYLRELIESVVAQTFPHWELVVVDNASSDGTRELVAQYQRKFPGQFQYIQLESNIGWAPGITIAAERAAGDFLLFIGDDDLLMPDMLEREIQEFKKNPQLALVCANVWYGEQPFLKTLFPEEFRGPVNESVSVPMYFNPYSCGCAIAIQTALFRKEVYRRVGGLNPNRHPLVADTELTFQVLTRFPVTYLPVPLAFFRRHHEQVTVTACHDEYLEGQMQYWEEVKQNIEDKYKRAVLDWMFRLKIYAALYHYRSNEPLHYRRFWKHLTEAFQYGMPNIGQILVFLVDLVPRPAWRTVRSLFPSAWRRIVRRILDNRRVL